jgi:hypothetical protein
MTHIMQFNYKYPIVNYENTFMCCFDGPNFKLENLHYNLRAKQN